MEKNPKNEHARLKKENEKLLKLIGAELENQTSENPHWGDVGDLEHSKPELFIFLKKKITTHSFEFDFFVIVVILYRYWYNYK